MTTADQLAAGGEYAAVRLTFGYRGNHVEVTSVQRIEMAFGAGDALQPTRPAGVSAEVRDAAGVVLYRHHLPDAMRHDVEIFDPGVRPSIRRMPLTRPVGAFTVVVPEPVGADHVTLIRAGGETALRSPVELVRVSVTRESDSP